MPHLLAVTAVALAAGLHAATVAFLVAGGPLSARHPWLARWHLAVAVAVGAVFVAGAPCPLTLAEDAARRAAGWPAGDAGFLERYLLHPLGLEQGGAVTAGLVAAWLVPSVLGHAARRRSARVALVG